MLTLYAKSVHDNIPVHMMHGVTQEDTKCSYDIINKNFFLNKRLYS
jgi:hypothetical protein